MKVIGLTGGIASGKSTASAYLRSLGAQVVDADLISRQITRKRMRGYDAVLRHFGPEILAKDGEIDRARLGALVFSNAAQRRALDALLHPIVIEESIRQIEQLRASGAQVCILDVPLLFESGMERLCDWTVLIYVPLDEQIRRVMQRDGLDQDAALRRINSQMPLDEKMRRADHAVDASGTIEHTQQLLRRLWEEIA